MVAAVPIHCVEQRTAEDSLNRTLFREELSGQATKDVGLEPEIDELVHDPFVRLASARKGFFLAKSASRQTVIIAIFLPLYRLYSIL